LGVQLDRVIYNRHLKDICIFEGAWRGQVLMELKLFRSHGSLA